MRDDEQAQHVDLAVWIAMKYKYEKPSYHVEPCRTDAFRRQDHEYHHDDDARPEGKSNAKMQRTPEKEYDPWSEDQGINDDEVPYEEVIPEFLVESWILTFYDKKHMQDALDDMMRSRFDPSPANQGCERNLNALPRYLYNKDLFYLKYANSEKRKYVLSLHKIHHLWAKISYNQGHLATRLNPEDVYSDHKIVEERVHDYQLGMEIYQTKVNLTTPKLTFPGIKEKTPYLITTLPFVGLIYENSKKRNRIMDIDEISKFCDATLKMVLEKVKRINIDVKHGYANLVLSNTDADLMRFYEEYIQDRLKHRDQMRRWKSYVNGRPLRLRNERP
ncbi:hypothetical protein Tco_0266939 [Tanacetum coccineum]